MACDGHLPLPKAPRTGFNFAPDAIERDGVAYPGQQERWQVIR